jgi:hypothetical protein
VNARALAVVLVFPVFPVFSVFAAACGGTTDTTDSTAKTSGGGASSGGASASDAGAMVGSGGRGAASGGAGGDVGVGGSPIGVVQACTLNSDCAGALVCVFGLCHAQCAAVKDCPANQRCVQLGGGDAGPTTRICQLEQESHCVHNSDCLALLVCAPDQQCRNQCQANRDCIAGQVCRGSSPLDGGPGYGVCVDPNEL